MSTHNIGFGRDIIDVEYHHSLLSGDLKCCYLCLNSGRVENIVRKEENTCKENFLIFPHYSIQAFSRKVTCRTLLIILIQTHFYTLEDGFGKFLKVISLFEMCNFCIFTLCHVFSVFESLKFLSKLTLSPLTRAYINVQPK